MPVVGAVGAISAANRANRARRSGYTASASGYTSSGYKSPYTTASSRVAKQVPLAPSPSDISETASVDSKPSVLSMLKQQAQETGGFFKRQKDLMAEKAQKGLKMASSTISAKKADVSAAISGKKADVSTQQKNDVPVEEAEKVVSLDPAWIKTLEQMGFSPSQVERAVVQLGRKPEQIDDLLQVLLTMPTSPASFFAGALSPPNSGTASSSTDGSASVTSSSTDGGASVATPGKMKTSLAAAVQLEDADLISPNSAAELVAEIVDEVELGLAQEAATGVLSATDEAPAADEFNLTELAAAVVAAAVSKASEKILSKQHDAMQPKQLFEAPLAASPVRGGA